MVAEQFVFWKKYIEYTILDAAMQSLSVFLNKSIEWLNCKLIKTSNFIKLLVATYWRSDVTAERFATTNAQTNLQLNLQTQRSGYKPIKFKERNQLLYN